MPLLKDNDMKPGRAYLLILVTTLIMCPQAATAGKQEKIASLSATAKGKGTISIGDSRKHNISAVVVNLKEGGEADIVLVTDLQLFVRGTWTAPEDISKGIALKITGGIVSGNATGAGTLFVRSGAKSIDKLSLEARGSGRDTITVEFTANKEDEKP